MKKPVKLGKNRSENRQFVVLFRHFLLRMFHNDVLKFEDQRRENFIILLSFFIAAGSVLSVFILMPYLIAMLGYTSETVWVEKTLFITLSMAFTGIISVINWNNLYLDEKDYLHLTGLPVSTGALFTAKFFSLLAFVGIISLAIHVGPVLIFTFFLGEIYNVNPFYHTSIVSFALVHLVTSFMANLFVFLVVALIQGIVLLLPGTRGFKKISMAVQTLLLMGFVSIFIWFPHTASTLEKLKEQYHSFIYYFPPLWFVGFYEQMIGNYDMVFKKHLYIAPAVVVLLMNVYAFSIPLCFKRYSSPYSAGKVESAFSRMLAALKRSFDHIFLGNSLQKAIFYFSLSVLNRSRKHKLHLAVFITLPVTFVMTHAWIKLYRGGWAYFTGYQPLLIAIPLLLYFFVVLGFRVVVSYPAAVDANWIFQLTVKENPTPYIKGLKKVILLFGILPIFAVLLAFYSFCWGVIPALLHSVFSVTLAWVILELFFVHYRKIPFVSAYIPGKAGLKYFWGLYLLGFALYMWGFSALGMILLRNPIFYFIYYLLLADALYLLRRYRLKRENANPVVFDEEPEPAMLGFGLDP